MNFKLVKNLCEVAGVSGREHETADMIRSVMEPYCDKIEMDDAGNLICTKQADDPDAPTILLDAHMDTIGFVVSEVLEGGFLKVQNMGGVDERILPGCEVTVYGKERVSGIIGSKPPHLMTKEEGKQFAKLEDLVVDTGFPGREIFEIVRPGDMVSFVQQADLIGKCVTATYLDDRAGVAAIIEVFERLKGQALPFHLTAAFTVQEELGLIGAKSGHEQPDLAIVIDVTHGSTPDEKGDRVYQTGGGTAIGMGPNVHPAWFDRIVSVAKKKGIPYQIEVMEGNTGTNAWAYQVRDQGIGCLILSLPLKFMHTPVETLEISDYDNLVRLTEAFLCQIRKEDILEISDWKVIKGE